MKMVKLYGLKTCDTCRKAKNALENSGKTVVFVDVRETPLERAFLERLEREFGAALVNRRSTTWRSLSKTDRERPAVELLQEHPTLMKRPVIMGGSLTLGWDISSQAKHLG